MNYWANIFWRPNNVDISSLVSILIVFIILWIPYKYYPKKKIGAIPSKLADIILKFFLILIPFIFARITKNKLYN